MDNFKEVIKLWPELNWINNEVLRYQVARTWELTLERSVLKTDDLNNIPFTLLCGPDLKVSFMDHKRVVVHIAYESGLKMNEFFKDELPVDMDVLVAGAILADVGKLLEYELDENGKAVQGMYGKYLRHPFSGVSLAEECKVPPEVCHIIATHAGEGDMVKRSTEAYVVHHADFMTFLPFKSRLK
ncbi:HDIG domain-containing metalloprotein [Carboxylicivirga linearis]|uniref:HDIG domain-containing protein n=1 Tax=Carboxylicivirga linearis TaxID=1628157 RepID=A0ABS5JXA3_9BACT|nr:HDIG domain-containing metalloprotein [Carboxylicivirga linearis]MBS2099488.1 HDIG domain-containing protein [Carboxylicivirga linearis]